MILLDSNIIIYAASEHHKSLRDLLKNYESCCSIISQLEVLGFPKITTEQTKFFEAMFKLMDILPITEELIKQAISYRKRYNMSVADAIIAATAKIYNAKLYTNNEKDFKNIKDISIVNPIK
ncbi:MAG: type II toxin-antitoxin system VapC family toxin [Bacteroidetes bacterium]|nr:type II toxin-antitoxin system VapC family toxin [Bacteroidota bacterium]